jgi:hypothetical protein
VVPARIMTLRYRTVPYRREHQIYVGYVGMGCPMIFFRTKSGIHRQNYNLHKELPPVGNPSTKLLCYLMNTKSNMKRVAGRLCYS